MENHWVLWGREGGRGDGEEGVSNCLTVPMVLAQLHRFNHDMSMLLPGKLWIQFLTPALAPLLVSGRNANLYCPQKVH